MQRSQSELVETRTELEYLEGAAERESRLHSECQELRQIVTALSAKQQQPTLRTDILSVLPTSPSPISEDYGSAAASISADDVDFGDEDGEVEFHLDFSDSPKPIARRVGSGAVSSGASPATAAGLAASSQRLERLQQVCDFIRF